jgi:sulfate/thiosulfate transport system substrate-binding protein
MRAVTALLALATLPGLGGCGGAGSKTRGKTLTIAAYTVTREVLGREIIPGFKQSFAGGPVQVEESYEASGAQTRSLISGFEGDVALLSMSSDMEKLVKAKLITHDWKTGPGKGMVSRSLVVFVVRKGNPKGLRDWPDLTRPGVEVLTPNPETSGGARWNITAICADALKQRGLEAALQILAAVRANVIKMDKSGRESMTTFEFGIGDVAITYENEARARLARDADIEIVIPRSTVLIENPAAVLDVYVDRNGTRALAEAFVTYLTSDDGQRAFVRHGFRPVVPKIEAESRAQFGQPERLYTIQDLGGWKSVGQTLFDKDGLWAQAGRRVASR